MNVYYFDSRKDFFPGLLVIFGLLTLVLFFVWGAAQVAAFVSPVLMWTSRLLIGIFVFYYPLALVKKWRPALSASALFMSMVLNVTIWIYAFVFIVNALGIWGMVTMLFLQLLYPVALVGAVAKGAWAVAGNIIAGLFTAWTMRLFSIQFMGPKGPAAQSKPQGDIIDVEVVRKRDEINGP